MEIILKDITVKMIKEYAKEAGVKIPLKSQEDIDTLAAFFEDMEGDLSNAYVSGRGIDETLLDAIVTAHDDLNVPNYDDYIDVEKLNSRLLK